MKKIFVILLTLLLLTGCRIKIEYGDEKTSDTLDNMTGNIYGKVLDGAGDCFPGGGSKRNYQNYDGTAYFVEKNEFEITPGSVSTGGNDYINLPSEDAYEDILDDGIELDVDDGEFSVDLDVGDYVFLIDDYSKNRWSQRIVHVEAGVSVEKTFKYWECTSS